MTLVWFWRANVYCGTWTIYLSIKKQSTFLQEYTWPYDRPFLWESFIRLRHNTLVGQSRFASLPFCRPIHSFVQEHTERSLGILSTCECMGGMFCDVGSGKGLIQKSARWWPACFQLCLRLWRKNDPAFQGIWEWYVLCWSKAHIHDNFLHTLPHTVFHNHTDCTPNIHTRDTVAHNTAPGTRHIHNYTESGTHNCTDCKSYNSWRKGHTFHSWRLFTGREGLGWQAMCSSFSYLEWRLGWCTVGGQDPHIRIFRRLFERKCSGFGHMQAVVGIGTCFSMIVIFWINFFIDLSHLSHSQIQ